MVAFIVRRLLLAVLTIWVISILSFAIIQLPPGDFVTAYIAQLSASGASVSAQEAAALRELYGLGQPFYVQYLKWIGRVVVGDFGVSMEWNRPVTEVIGDRLWLTMLISFAALIVTWGLALPIGIYSAVRQYSVGDYLFTLIGFIGLAVPNFLLALVIMYLRSASSAPTWAGCSAPNSSLRRGAGPRRGICSSICRCPRSSSRSAAPRSSFVSCEPTCSTNCAGPTW